MFNQKEYVKKWQIEHKEQQKEYHHEYYLKHKEYFKNYQKEHYKKKEYNCKICGTKINLGKFCDACALDKTKVSRQVVSLRKKKLNREK